MYSPLPIPESYWVIPGRFLAGEYPGDYDESKARRRISAFLEAGFTEFIDLTQARELVPYERLLKGLAKVYGIQTFYTRIPVEDFGLPSRETMQKIIQTIDGALAKNRKVYLHCWGGVGRTGTAVGCYLVQHGMTGPDAIRQIGGWWANVPKQMYYPRSPETERQMEFILDWVGSTESDPR